MAKEKQAHILRNLTVRCTNPRSVAKELLENVSKEQYEHMLDNIQLFYTGMRVTERTVVSRGVNKGTVKRKIGFDQSFKPNSDAISLYLFGVPAETISILNNITLSEHNQSQIGITFLEEDRPNAFGETTIAERIAGQYGAEMYASFVHATMQVNEVLATLPADSDLLVDLDVEGLKRANDWIAANPDVVQRFKDEGRMNTRGRP